MRYNPWSDPMFYLAILWSLFLLFTMAQGLKGAALI